MASKKKAAGRRRKRIGTGQDKVDRINRMVSIVEALADSVENLPDKKPLQEIEIFQATEKLHEQLKRIHG